MFIRDRATAVSGWSTAVSEVTAGSAVTSAVRVKTGTGYVLSLIHISEPTRPY